MTKPPFALPLSPTEFTSALHKGLGRAAMHVRSHGITGVEDPFVDTCLHARQYDPQCEDDRAPWLISMLDAIARPGADRLITAILAGLDLSTDRFWDVKQRCRLARDLGARGHESARVALYAAMRKWHDTMDLVGANDIIALDGADGLVHVAQYLGSLLLADPELRASDSPLDWFDEGHAEGTGRRVLNAIAPNDAAVAEYLRRLDAPPASDDDERKPGSAYRSIDNIKFDLSRPSPAARRTRDRTADDVIREIETTDPEEDRFWFNYWGKHAPGSALTEVFEAMVRQTHPGRLCKYLRVFSSRWMQALDPRLLAFAHHDDSDVRSLANKALANYADPRVRGLALDRLRSGRVTENVLELLKKNYLPGDAALIEPSLHVADNVDVHHWMIFDLVHLFEEHPGAEAAGCMLFAYEHSPCENCRHVAVKVLIEDGVAPAWLVDECHHDADASIRKLVGAPSGPDDPD